MTDANFALPLRAKPWPTDRWGTLICRAAWEEVPGVRSFLLVPEDGARIVFTAGQYMTFRLPSGDGLVERCYTISSSASRTDGIEITIKHQPQGEASGLFHETLTVGARIAALGPVGQFSPATLGDGPYALIAAGSGVTPMLSILRTAADRGIDLDAVFIHVAGSLADAIAADELPQLHRKLPKLQARVVPTRDRQNRERESRLTPEKLHALVPDLAERIVLCCGPEGFMQMVQTAAQDAGVPAHRYAQESFDFATPVDDLPVDGVVRSFRITFSRSGAAFNCADGASILSAARAAGVAMPSSCARGQCGTCKAFKHIGDVEMVHEGGIRQREIDRGLVLPCVCRPRTDVTLDL